MTDRAVDMIVDTDGGADDAVALLIATLSGRARLRAVTTVAGNVPVAQATRNALVTLELAGAGDVPVFPGAAAPLVRGLEMSQHFHGRDGMGDSDLPEPTSVPCEEHAVEALLRLARASAPDGLTLVTLGPLTNVALALGEDPGFLGRFRQVVCMAGAADGVGNVTATAEFNAWADPEAPASVLGSAQPERVTWVGWDASRRDAVMTPVDQQALTSIGTPVARFVTLVNRAASAWATTVAGLDGYDLPDPLAMAVAVDPTLVTAQETAAVTVGLEADGRGTTFVEQDPDAAAANVTLVRRADRERFRQLLFSVCRSTSAAPAWQVP